MARSLFPIQRYEWRFVWVVAAVVIILTLAPLGIGALRMPASETFVGFDGATHVDKGVYLSYIEQARDTGHVFFANAYADAEGGRSFFQPLWAVIGYAAGLFRLPGILMFHLARAVCVLPLVAMLYACASIFLQEVRTRRIALVLACFGSGLGLYALPFLTDLVPDVVYAQLTTFQTIAHSPLSIIALTLLLFIIALAAIDEREPGRVPLVIFAAAALLLAVLHPYDVPVVLAVLGVLCVTRLVREPGYRQNYWRRSVTRLVYMGAAAFMVLIYFIGVYTMDPAMQGFARQNICITPAIPLLLLGLGCFPLLALIGLRVLRPLRGEMLLLIVWPAVSLILSYLPVQVQSRFLLGIQVALVIPAAYLLTHIWARISIRWQLPRFFLAVIVYFVAFMFLAPTTPVSMAEPLIGAERFGNVRVNYRMPRATQDAMKWLLKQPRGRVLSAPSSGFLLASLYLLPTYIADPGQTPAFYEKRALLMQALAAPKAEGLMQKFLIANNIRYIFWSSAEQEFFKPFSPAVLPDVALVHSTSTVSIYALTRE